MLGLGYPILTPRAITEGGLSAPRGNGQRHRSPYSPTRSLPFGGGHQHRTMRASTSAVSLDHHLSHAAHHQGRIASYDRIIHAVLMQVCIARSAMALDTWIFCSSDRLPLVGLRSGLLDYMGDGSVRAELPIARSCRGTCVSRVRCRSVNHIISSLPENDRLIACSSALTRAATQVTTAAQDAWPCCSQ
jgi:hypothetical protein